MGLTRAGGAGKKSLQQAACAVFISKCFQCRSSPSQRKLSFCFRVGPIPRSSGARSKSFVGLYGDRMNAKLAAKTLTCGQSKKWWGSPQTGFRHTSQRIVTHSECKPRTCGHYLAFWRSRHQPRPTSRIIITTNPSMAAVVAKSVLPLRCASGIVSSITTKIMAPAAKPRAYGRMF